MRIFLFFLAASLAALCSRAQSLYPVENTLTPQITPIAADSLPGSLGNTMLELADGSNGENPFMLKLRRHTTFSPFDMRPAVFDTYDMVDSLSLSSPLPSDSLFASDAFNWLDDLSFNERLVRQTRQRYMIANPQLTRYNERLLPEPPRKFHIEVDPASARLTFVPDSLPVLAGATPDLKITVDKKHWLHYFDARLQFSQAYISPNWYQGGSNSLTALLGITYNVKLNQNYHPNLMAEFNSSYKFSVNGTPEDSIRNYNITEDLLQINAKAGIRAWRKWFYSVNMLFKTQFFNNYEVNSRQLRAAFLSPAELNVGLGMTYNYVDKKKKLTFDASISPLSWNLKTCIHADMDVTNYGIRLGHKTAHEIGSNAEFKLDWKISYNIHYVSRLYAFTDYEYFQGDWENTFTFDINRFLQTMLQFHLRYDSSTPRPDDLTKWHKLQLREVLSFGFYYKFATI